MSFCPYGSSLLACQKTWQNHMTIVSLIATINNLVPSGTLSTKTIQAFVKQNKRIWCELLSKTKHHFVQRYLKCTLWIIKPHRFVLLSCSVFFAQLFPISLLWLHLVHLWNINHINGNSDKHLDVYIVTFTKLFIQPALVYSTALGSLHHQQRDILISNCEDGGQLPSWIWPHQK